MATIEERTITEIKIKPDDEELINLRYKALKKFIAKRIDEIEYSLLIKQKEFEADEEFLEKFKKQFLECDGIRANLREYPEEILFNPQLGHWDLFDYNDSIDSDIKVKLPKPIYSRDPKDDIVKSWVGIDFGTKSTVVSYRDSGKGRKIIPINVGKVQGASDLSEYENPSVMYFINFDKFWKDYNSKEGRPDTRWDDLSVAHDALNDLKNADERNFESFLTDLKSWCGSNDIVRVKPRENEKPLEFKKFLEIGDDDPNPVEYYAYFLGLYINNMHRGKIFMNYKMSFPVFFEKKLREKILKSFARGIKKSFPTALLKDEKIMSQFKVVEGVEEPVAYALTVFEKFNFRSNEVEEDYYSIFDFGSSCTDFDFGVYCGLIDDEIEELNADHRLIHFGYDGDRRLGGEKLLKYLAFEIFKINKDELFNNGNGNKIQFTTYDGSSPSESIGFESLINNQSTYANRNMYNLMEKLRWAWEGVKPSEEYLEYDYEVGQIFVDLVNTKGELILNFPLSSYKWNEDGSPEVVDLQELLRERIENTVENFFKSMRTAFKDGVDDKRYDIKPLKDISVINIFLAGNSSKSKLFLEILDDYILGGKAKKILGLDENCPLKFEIFPLLGTDEAIEIQKERGYNVNIDDKTEPNGDRAISYGLLIEGIDVLPKIEIKEFEIDKNNDCFFSLKKNYKSEISKRDYEVEIGNLNIEISKLQSIICELSNEKEKFDSQVQALESEKCDLNKIIDDHNKETAKLQVTVRNLTKQLEEERRKFEAETRNNSKILEFAKIFVDEEKKSFQVKHDEDLSKIGKLEAERVVFENNFNEILREKSAFEEKIAIIEKELDKLKDENLKLNLDNKILYTKNDHLKCDCYKTIDELNKLKADYRTIDSKLRDCKNEISNLERELSVKNDEIKILNDENRVIGSKLKNNGSFVAKKKVPKKK